jgi:hypothetical protein
MDAATQVVFIQMPLLLVVAVAGGALAWRYHEGVVARLLEGRLSIGSRAMFIAAIVVVWAAVTIASWWCVFLGAYLSLFAAYVVFGVPGGWVALVASALAMVSVPVIWGVILFGLARRELRHVTPAPKMPAARHVRAVPS